MPLPRVVCLSTAACAIALATLADSTSAQSFNIDIHSAPGFGAALPASTYAAAAGQPGTWNQVGSASPTNVALVNLDGSASSVTLTRALNGTFVNTTNVTTSGQFSSLHDDYQRLSPSGTLVYTFNNLAAGDYAVFTYAANPDNAGSKSLVSVAGTVSMPTQIVGGAINGNKWIPGTTHAIHVRKNVAAGGSITVNVVADPLNGFACCGGIQLVKMTSPRLRFYTNDNAAGINAGASWTDAYTDLQMCLGSVLRAGGGNAEVWVAQGTYLPGTDRGATFLIPPSTQMYGGFAGTETSLSQRTNPAQFVTSLSGDIGGVSVGDNAYNVVTMDDSSTGTHIIDGFTITRGYDDFGGHGAGVLITGDCSPRFRNCKFIANEARLSGGAVYVGGATGPQFVNCLFLANNSERSGGAIMFDVNSTAFKIVNCQFLGNFNLLGTGGGAVAAFGQAGEIVNTVFSGNYASSGNARGGAVRCFNESADVTFRGCTFARNYAGTDGGGVAAYGGADITLHNCILWNNFVGSGSGFEWHNVFADGFQDSFSTLSFCTVEGAPGVNGQDPLFIDADGPDNTVGTIDDNLRLQITSPSIDAGDNNQIGNDFNDMDADGNFAEGVPFDLDLNARRIDIGSVPDTGSGGRPAVDRGAYEAVPPTCPGDFNNDGQRNTADLVIFLGQFGQAGNLPADLNNDNAVNTADLVIFLGVFGVPCP